MGGFSSSNPLVKVGSTAVQAVSGLPGVHAALTLAEARAQNQASQSAVKGNYDRQAELLGRQQARQIQERQDLLKRATATQRARLGAMGIGGENGSANALINGLQRQTATEVADIQSAFDINLSTLDWNRQRQEGQLAQALREQWGASAAPLINSILPGKKQQQGATPKQTGGDFFNIL